MTGNETSPRRRVLFVCAHNSARSVMAEAYLKLMGGDRFEVKSAGFSPMPVLPSVVAVMAEEGIDVSGHRPHSILDAARIPFDYVVTACSPRREANCPVLPGAPRREHWDLPQPSDFTGSYEEILALTRAVRDAIKAKVADFIAAHEAEGR